MFYIILYPEKRRIRAHQIRVWYEDAVANGEVEDITLTETSDMAMELHRAGIITLKKT